jgi:hypothetical protein
MRMSIGVGNSAAAGFLVPMARIERATSPLPRECSATELHGLNWDGNGTPWSNGLERVKGIEPSS